MFPINLWRNSYKFLIIDYCLYINLLLLFLSFSPSLPLEFLAYPLILGKIKTNGLITLSNYLIKYLELLFVSINFEITVLSASTSQIFRIFCTNQISNYYTIKSFAFIIFSLNQYIFLKTFYNNTGRDFC